MTNEQKQAHLIRFQKFQQSREKHFAPLINIALHNQYKTFLAHFEREGIEALHRIEITPLTVILKQLYYDAALVYGAKIRADLEKHKSQKNRRPMGFSERMKELVESYFKTDILNVCAGITETTKELIRKTFTAFYEQGKGFNEMVKALEGTELSKIRARLIARTETVTAANQGAMFVAKDSGLKLNKTWLATLDNRTRDDHMMINGRTIPLDDYFTLADGSQMMQPGDRGGTDGRLSTPAAEVVNCRCTTTFEPIRDSNGRLVTV